MLKKKKTFLFYFRSFIVWHLTSSNHLFWFAVWSVVKLHCFVLNYQHPDIIFKKLNYCIVHSWHLYQRSDHLICMHLQLRSVFHRASLEPSFNARITLLQFIPKFRKCNSLYLFTLMIVVAILGFTGKLRGEIDKIFHLWKIWSFIKKSFIDVLHCPVKSI